MPNPNPVKRTRRATPAVDDLPSGMTRVADRPGLIKYRWTERGERFTRYGRSVDELYAARYAPTPEPVTVDERTTLAEYLELWVGGLKLRTSTVDEHRRNVVRIVELFGERVRLVDVSRELVELRFTELGTRTSRYGRPFEPGTIRNTFSTLRSAMGSAVDHGRIKANPCARLNVLRTDAAESRVGLELPIPTELEVRRVIRTVAGEPFAILLSVAASTGLRQSELLGLGLDDLDLVGRWIHVRRSLDRRDRTLGRTKNASSARHVPIARALVPILEEWVAERGRLELVAGDRWHDSDLLFVDELGEPIAGSTVSHWFADACRRARLDRAYRWHDLRHAYASNLLAARVPIERVAKLLGHASTSITFRTYWHLIRDEGTLDDAELAGAVLAV
jgi:integrase